MLCMLTKTQASFGICIDAGACEQSIWQSSHPLPLIPLLFTVLLPVRPLALVPVRS